MYETPRDKGKWNVQNDNREKNISQDTNDKKAHLEALKKRFQQNKKWKNKAKRIIVWPCSFTELIKWELPIGLIAPIFDLENDFDKCFDEQSNYK